MKKITKKAEKLFREDLKKAHEELECYGEFLCDELGAVGENELHAFYKNKDKGLLVFFKKVGKSFVRADMLETAETILMSEYLSLNPCEDWYSKADVLTFILGGEIESPIPAEELYWMGIYSKTQIVEKEYRDEYVEVEFPTVCCVKKHVGNLVSANDEYALYKGENGQYCISSFNDDKKVFFNRNDVSVNDASRYIDEGCLCETYHFFRSQKLSTIIKGDCHVVVMSDDDIRDMYKKLKNDIIASIIAKMENGYEIENDFIRRIYENFAGSGYTNGCSLEFVLLNTRDIGNYGYGFMYTSVPAILLYNEGNLIGRLLVGIQIRDIDVLMNINDHLY